MCPVGEHLVRCPHSLFPGMILTTRQACVLILTLPLKTKTEAGRGAITGPAHTARKKGSPGLLPPCLCLSHSPCGLAVSSLAPGRSRHLFWFPACACSSPMLALSPGQLRHAHSWTSSALGRGTLLSCPPPHKRAERCPGHL